MFIIIIIIINELIMVA